MSPRGRPRSRRIRRQFKLLPEIDRRLGEFAEVLGISKSDYLELLIASAQKPKPKR